MKKFLALIAIFALVLSVSPVFAQVPEPVVNEDPTLQEYGAQSASKLARGLGNVLLGWTQPIQDVRNNDGAKGPVQVWVEGIGNGVVRTAAGVAQVLTSVVPSVEWEGDAEMNVN
jgi:predicted PurR-regulated permease PerM